MKKAIFFPPACGNTKFNEFESCRGEGRAIMNIAFGFSLLGYESHIINNWNLDKPKKIWNYQNNNVYISNKPDPNETYDIALTYDSVHILNSKNYKQKILMSYESSNINKANEYIKSNNLENITLVCSHESVKDPNKNPFNLKYFPVIFPIPSINIGFIPYNTKIFEPNNKELKIYVFHSSWPGSACSNLNCCRHKQFLILKFLRSKCPDSLLKIHVHIEDEKYINNSEVNPFTTNNFDANTEIHYIPNRTVQYNDIINLLQQVDLCIPVGGLNTPGSGVLDMLSLGKPIISAVDGVNKDSEGKTFEAFNTLYKCSDNLIMTQESYEISLKKLERIFSDNNLELSYNCYKNCIKDYDYNNWKEIVEKFLSDIS